MTKLSKEETSSILASFATLKSLYEAKKYKSSYHILSEFIKYIIASDALYNFTAIEMKNKLKEHFDFSIPEAVVKTSSKKIDGISVNRGVFSIDSNMISPDPVFKEKIESAVDYNSVIISDLEKYIKSRTGEENVCTDKLTKELSAFLVDGESHPNHRYAEYISEYILIHEDDEEIQKGLDKIREGSIIYMGLSYNIVETGSITNPITLYLGTEILFSIVGYNGEIYDQLAQDFFEQVRMANSKSANKIKLRYFSETKLEIEEFFKAAESVVNGKNCYIYDRPAMKIITNGCMSEADVIVKKSDFYYKLQYQYGITEDTYGNYYTEDDFKYNLEGADEADEESQKRAMAVRFISHINKLRDGEIFVNDLDAKHLIVTNSKTVVYASRDEVEKIKKEEGLTDVCNFAISLDKITNLLWYKLGTGFGNRAFTSSVSAILKARTVLSSTIARNAKKVYEETKKQFNDGTIDYDQLASRIITIKNKPVLPEDLKGDNIDETMDFSPEYLSRYEEKVKATKEQLEEKEKIINDIKLENDKKLTERESTIAQKDSLIKEKEAENITLKGKLEEYAKLEAERELKKKKQQKLFSLIFDIAWKAAALAVIAVIIVLLDSKFDHALIQYVGLAVELIGIAVAVFTVIKKAIKDYRSDPVSDKAEKK